jgi:hypothetical protein
MSHSTTHHIFQGCAHRHRNRKRGGGRPRVCCRSKPLLESYLGGGGGCDVVGWLEVLSSYHDSHPLQSMLILSFNLYIACYIPLKTQSDPLRVCPGQRLRHPTDGRRTKIECHPSPITRPSYHSSKQAVGPWTTLKRLRRTNQLAKWRPLSGVIISQTHG